MEKAHTCAVSIQGGAHCFSLPSREQGTFSGEDGLSGHWGMTEPGMDMGWA